MVQLHRQRNLGQALVETALVLPVLIFILLACASLLIVTVSYLRAENGITVLAQLAAQGENWHPLVNGENERTGCHASPLQPKESHPNGDLSIELTWHCSVLIPAPPGEWSFDVSSEQALAGPSPTASPSPSPSATE